MTEDEFEAIADKLAEVFIEAYASMTERAPKAVVVMAMAGALAACAIEAGVPRNNLVRALESAIDDIEAGDGS